MRCVVYRGTGGREVMAIEERPDPTPSSSQVVVAPAFAGVNPADVLQREGRHPVPPGWPADIPGLEVAGTVVGVGDGVTGFRPGDRAFGLVGGGGLADRVVAEAAELLPVPPELDDMRAAAVPEAFTTAFDAAVLQGGLGEGCVFLVNGANGGVGTAAVQIGRALGATVVASVRSPELRPRVAELGAVAAGPDEAFERAAELGGADVILELVGGPNMVRNLDVLARRGRIVVVGAKPGEEITVVLRDLMSRRGRLIGTTLRMRPAEEKAALAAEFGRRVVPLLASGAVTPLVDRVFPLEAAADALDHVREPGKFGKVLLEMPAGGG
jgi:NADPH2:quinone reductase